MDASQEPANEDLGKHYMNEATGSLLDGLTE